MKLSVDDKQCELEQMTEHYLKSNLWGKQGVYISNASRSISHTSFIT